MPKLDEVFSQTGRVKRGVLAKSEESRKTKQESTAELLAKHGIRLRNLEPGQQKLLMPGGAE